MSQQWAIEENGAIASALLYAHSSNKYPDFTREESDFARWFPDLTSAVRESGFKFVTMSKHYGYTVRFSVQAASSEAERLEGILAEHASKIAPMITLFSMRKREGRGFAASQIPMNIVTGDGLISLLPHMVTLVGGNLNAAEFDERARAPYWLSPHEPILLCQDHHDAVLAKLML